MVLRPLHPSLPSGSICTEIGPQRDVRFPLDSDQTADIAGGPFCANSGSARLFDHFVSELLEMERHVQAERLGGL